MLLAKLDKTISRVSRKLRHLEPLNGEPIHCNPPLGIPKWAVDAGSIQRDGVLSKGQLTQPDPMAEPTEQSEFKAVV